MAAQNGVVALIGVADGRRSRERRAPGHVYMTLAGKGLTLSIRPLYLYNRADRDRPSATSIKAIMAFHTAIGTALLVGTMRATPELVAEPCATCEL